MLKKTPVLVFAVLAACADGGWEYPTHYREGSPLPGATTADICAAIEVEACTSDACSTNFMQHCGPSAGAYVEATSIELWNQLWDECLTFVSSLDGYAGVVQPVACVRLTPNWR